MKKIVSFFGDQSPVFVMLNERAARYAESLGFDYQWKPQNPFSQESVVRALQESDVGIIDVEPYGDPIFREIDQKVKLLVRFGVGYDKVDLKAASAHGIAIARTTGANTLGVAEMALTLILSARRKLRANQSYVQSGNWVKDVANETIESTIGIVGFGAIGKALARLLKGFDVRIIAYDPMPDHEAMKAMGVELVELDELFRTSDAISIHVPYMPATHHLVNAERLNLMKQTAVIVNTSRGNIVDEQALYETLKVNRIAGAALDVFGQEPLPTSSPLLDLPNMILTPHVSSQTVESLWRIYKMAIDISDDFFCKGGSPHILNPDYRKD